MHEKLEAAKKVVRENLRGPQNVNGVLTRHWQAYIECLEVKKEQLEELFMEDEEHWKQNIQKAKASMAQM